MTFKEIIYETQDIAFRLDQAMQLHDARQIYEAHKSLEMLASELYGHVGVSRVRDLLEIAERDLWECHVGLA